MRFFASELGHHYPTFTFGYSNYGVLEDGDDVSELYERGYLPYSGSPESKGLFYMARSGRVHLPSFELSSECRRVAAKFDGAYVRKTVPRAELELSDDFISFWLEYYERIHGPGVMPRERLMHILDFGIVTHVGVYTDANGAVGGYTFEVSNSKMTHDWYQSYAPHLDKTSFGMWLLIDIACAAWRRGAAYYYPGTVYGGPDGLPNYKTNLPALEYWDGESWTCDKSNARLRSCVRTDARRFITGLDRFKEGRPLF